MTDTCDITVHLRIVASDGVTVVGDLNDQANGLSLLWPLGRPNHEPEWDRYGSPRAIGDLTNGAPRPTAGDLVAQVLVEGSTWAETNTRWNAVAAPLYSPSPGWLNLEWHYFVELEEAGVTTRWRTDVPSVTPGESDSIANFMVHEVRFHVQPNPSVDIA